MEFIGPPASAIRDMGSKSASKNIMEAANVPCTPGYHGEDQDMETLKAQANKMGFPIMLKAVLGGGGKGMRVVESPDELEANIEACQREALASFGDGRILLERFLRTPRHIELQVFADKYGNCVYLFERDCSVQRRHQKVLEEAPAPFMPEELRERMGSAAVAAAKAVGYVGAGTVEFMLDTEDPAQSFYFMEMNTRLQVEHPVTELITDKDLVELQLRVASGEELGFEQKDLEIIGHALEARIYAENPENDFLPGSGTLAHLRESVEGDGVRVDTGILEGDEVTVHYDPMIAKLIVHAEDRPSALRKMMQALTEYEVVGVPTNLEFIRTCVDHEAFAKGGVDVSFIEKHYDELLPEGEDECPDLAVALSTLASVLGDIRASEYKGEDSYDPFSPFNTGMVGKSSMPFNFRVNGDCATDIEFRTTNDRPIFASYVVVKESGDNATVTLDVTVSDESGSERTLRVSGSHVEDDESGRSVEATVDGERLRVGAVMHKNAVYLFGHGAKSLPRLMYQLRVPEPDHGSGDDAGTVGLRAPMPGKVVKVLVEDGQAVKEGEPLVILEAMKMEHVIKADRDGNVSDLRAEAEGFVDDSVTLLKIVSSE